MVVVLTVLFIRNTFTDRDHMSVVMSTEASKQLRNSKSCNSQNLYPIQFKFLLNTIILR